jgi:hypothetical protein
MSDSMRFAGAPLLSAEAPYFRIPRDDWELMLARARQLGANTVATYVPWCWHEPRPGELDLEGRTDPRRDLAGFVRLCARLGLRVILKPGPFVDAGLLGGGVPPWLLHVHPEIHALRPDGQPWRHTDSGLPRACYLHPTYLAAARQWIAAFSQAARPLQAPDGPLVALQVDNATPGDGMLPANIGLDPRFRLDYNPHVTDVLWPEWRRRTVDRGRRTVGRGPTTTDAEDRSAVGPSSSVPGPHALPRAFEPPETLADLRRYVELEAFTDWYHAEALATVAGWLREEGWAVPLFHNLLAAPWEAGGTVADAPGLARAAGWLGHSVYAEQVREPFVGEGAHRLSLEEYVHLAHWRTRLARALSPGHPALVPAISAAQDFIFAAPLLGGAQALNVSALPQVSRDEPSAAALPRWAMEAPVRPDGSVRPRFWNAKTVFSLLGACGADFAAARPPAAVAIGYSRVPERAGSWSYQHDYLRRGLAWEPSAELLPACAGGDHATRGQLLAQELLRAGVTFDVLDLDAATSEELASYALLLAPACGMLARETQRKLAACGNLALVGVARASYDEHLQPCAILDDHERRQREAEREAKHTAASLLPAPALSPLRLPEEIDGAQIAELVEEREGTPRHAWADAADVDVAVRYGQRQTYLFVANRRPAPYSGTIAYRSPAGDVLHVQVGLGALRVGVVAMAGDEVMGAAMGGDGSEGGWLARGMFSSIVFNAGAGAAAPCGEGVALTAPQSGRFQLRRRNGWDDMLAYRLLLGGQLLPAGTQLEAAHISVGYVAEDERGRTDMYLLLPAASDVPASLHEYLAILLLARAQMLRRLAGASDLGDTAAFGAAADGLEELAGRAFRLEDYGVAWAASEEACAAALQELGTRQAATRGASAAGLEGADAGHERRLAWALGLAARARLANDRE